MNPLNKKYILHFLNNIAKYKKLEYVIVVPLSLFPETHHLREKCEQFTDFYKTVFSIYLYGLLNKMI